MTCSKCKRGFLTTNEFVIRDPNSWNGFIPWFNTYCSNVKCSVNRWHG